MPKLSTLCVAILLTSTFGLSSCSKDDGKDISCGNNKVYCLRPDNNTDTCCPEDKPKYCFEDKECVAKSRSCSGNVLMDCED